MKISPKMKFCIQFVFAIAPLVIGVVVFTDLAAIAIKAILAFLVFASLAILWISTVADMIAKLPETFPKHFPKHFYKYRGDDYD